LRFETKWLSASKDIFEKENNGTTEFISNNLAITISLGLNF
jgi:hypothetical protein